MEVPERQLIKNKIKNKLHFLSTENSRRLRRYSLRAPAYQKLRAKVFV